MFRQASTSIFSYFAFSIQICLGIVFFLSSVSKFRHPLDFARNVIDYRVLPGKVAYVFAILLIVLEALLAIAFFTDWLINLALPICSLMLVAFSVAVWINLRRGRKISCGCFGNADEQISSRTLARLLLLLAVIPLLSILRGSEDISYSSLTVITVDGLFSPFFLLSVSLAVFLLLLTNWVFSLPELIPLFRYHNSGR